MYTFVNIIYHGFCLILYIYIDDNPLFWKLYSMQLQDFFLRVKMSILNCHFFHFMSENVLFCESSTQSNQFNMIYNRSIRQDSRLKTELTNYFSGKIALQMNYTANQFISVSIISALLATFYDLQYVFCWLPVNELQQFTILITNNFLYV